ncbi:transposase [Lichenibacterium minor]|uniref:Transposase n=1 Tax=Lichenibacterium minor TaxID=2316528 RepID=A0A4Q2U4V8_9HYPH|nr:transposase [Lichenibacterium minor]
MFLAIDRVSKFVYVEFSNSPSRAEGSAFLRGVVKAFPYQIRRVPADNGVAFTRDASTKYDMMQRPFDRVCDENGIEHRLPKPYHPWTDGQADCMNRTVKEATAKTLHYDTAHLLRAYVPAFIAAYDLARHLKALKWKMPYQAICSA